MSLLDTVTDIVGALPPDKVAQFVSMLGDLKAGRGDKAAQRARIIAQTLAIKEAARAPYRASRK